MHMDSMTPPPPPPPPPPSPSQAELPEDVIFSSILPRLPVRSLARFAAVCKKWRDLIHHDAAFAAQQAQSPSPASAALARFHDGRLEVLTPGAAAYVAPRDPSLSFLAAGGHYRPPFVLCACTAGLLCLKAVHSNTQRPVFCVVNPATGRSNLLWYSCPPGVAGLAYDPAAAAAGRGYHVVVADTSGVQTCRFFRFWSQAAGSGWRQAPDAARLAALEALRPNPEYAGGRVHWLTSQGNVVWFDVASESSGLAPPPSSSSGGRLDGNISIAAWRGRLRLACASSDGIGVWELASYGAEEAAAAARWDVVHWRSWSAIPGVVGPERCFLWSVVPAGMEAGGEEALGLALRYAHARFVDGEATGQMQGSCGRKRARNQGSWTREQLRPRPDSDEVPCGTIAFQILSQKSTEKEEAGGEDVEEDVWRRALVRYETRTGETADTVVLVGKEVHDYFGTVFGYHSSLAPLPGLNWDA